MKELEIKPQDAIEIREEQQQKKEVKLIGQQRRIKGLTLFEYNMKTDLITVAKFKKQTLTIEPSQPTKTKSTFHHKVEVNEDCFYIQALNEKSARRKINIINP